jgi:long-chain acyl-CoA synthetase
MSYSGTRTLAEYVDLALRDHGAHPFLAELDGRSVTYSQARDEIAGLHHLFRSAGIKPGDRVALLGNNSIHWGLVYLACVTYGAVAVPILTNFTASAVHNIINMSDARAIFVQASLLDKLGDVAYPHPEKIFLLEDFRAIDLHQVPKLFKKLQRKMEQFRERAHLVFSSRARRERLHGHPPLPGDLAAIVYTSGTTGQSKGVMLTQANLLSNAQAIPGIMPILPGDRLLSLLPLAHTYECTCGFLAVLQGGASITYLPGKPSPKLLLEALEKVRPTLIAAVPLIMEKLYFRMVRPKIDNSFILRHLTRFPAIRRRVHRWAAWKLHRAFGGQLRAMVFGGAPLNPDVEAFLCEGQFPFVMGYGMTECSPLITAYGIGQHRFQSCGRAIEGVTLRIHDPQPNSGVGEVWVKGPNVTRGYYKNEEATAALFDKEGWLKTGDLGYLDADGYLYLKGRSKNVILGPSGENIYPEEIENLLNESAYVLESLVVQRNNRLLAILVPDEEGLMRGLHLAGLTDAEIQARIRGAFQRLLDDTNRHLPDFSQVHGFEIQNKEFEKTPTEKIKRYLYQ